MKPTSKIRHFLLAASSARLAIPLAATLIAAAPAHAAIVQLSQNQAFDNSNADGIHAGTIQAVTTDLLQTSLDSSSGSVFVGSATVMHTGVISNVDSATTIMKAGTNHFVEYNFDVTTNLLGYDITQIDVFTYWTASDVRSGQNWSVYVKEVGSPTFDLLHSTGVVQVTGPRVHRVRLTDDADPVLGNIATGIESIRFEFTDMSAMINWQGYREIDVIGSATVPEPSTALTGLLLTAGFLLRRRR